MAAPNLLFMSLLKQSLTQSTTISLEAFDIYHESNIAEVQKLTPLLAEFSSRITELLGEFPEHPALIQVSKGNLYEYERDIVAQKMATWRREVA